jgi:hypothetical protein
VRRDLKIEPTKFDKDVSEMALGLIKLQVTERKPDIEEAVRLMSPEVRDSFVKNLPPEQLPHAEREALNTNVTPSAETGNGGE